MNWSGLLDEAQRQWSAGNYAGVRWCYNRLRDSMPVEVRHSFADLLATAPGAKLKHRPRKQPEVTARVVGDLQVELDYPLSAQFVIPKDTTVTEHVARLQAMGRETAVLELIAKLRRARNDNDHAALRRYGLRNVADTHFERRALEVARSIVFKISPAV